MWMYKAYLILLALAIVLWLLVAFRDEEPAAPPQDESDIKKIRKP